MKSIFALAAYLIITSSSNAQRNFWSETRGAFFNTFELNGYTASPAQKKAIKENQIKSKTTTHYSKGFNNTYKEYFDKEGNMIKKEYINSKSETVTNITYNAEHKITSIVTQNNKSEKWTTTMKYKNDLMVETEKFDEKGNYSGTKKEYNPEGLLLRHLLFEKSRTEPTHELVYTYYEDGSKKNIIYKEKGKFKYEWNFDCKEEGELVNVKTKDQSTICIKEEVDKDGNTIIWNREFSEDGNLIKTKEVRSVDNVLISRETFNQEDRLLSKSIMKESGGFLREGYNKKGEVSSRRETFTNNSGKLIKSEYTSKGLNYTYIYSYEGDLWSTNSRISKRRITVDQYQYEYY